MYKVRGTLVDGTPFTFNSPAEQIGTAMTELTEKLSKVKNESPVSKAIFVYRATGEAELVLVDVNAEKPARKKPKGAAK